MSARDLGADAMSGSSVPWQHRSPAEEEPFSHMISEGLLRPVGRRQGFFEYLAAIWRRREFMLYDARSRVLTQNRQNRLGSFWLLGKPLLDAAFFFIVFGLLLKVDRGIENFPAYIVIGVLMFRYTATALTSSAGLLRSNRAMIHAFSFPRGSLVFSFALRELLACGPLLAAVAVMIMAIPPHALPQWTWLLVFPLLGIQTVLNLGVSFIVARISFSFPDVSFAMSFLVRVLLYGSGVIFPVERFVNHPLAMSAVTGNPLFVLLSAYRQVLLEGTVPPAQDWGLLLLWSVGLALFGLILFWRSEEKYGRI